MESYLFNIANPEETRPDYSVRFWAGNIFDVPADIIVISAFKGGYYPVPKTLFGDLKRLYNITIDESQLKQVSENIKLYLPNTHSFPFKKIIIVEMINFKNIDVKNLIQIRFNELNQSLGRCFANTDTSISFPLIGTGNQGLPKETVALELLDLSRIFTATSITDVNIFARDMQAISLLNMNINKFLKRSVPKKIQPELLTAIIQELKVISTSEKQKGIEKEIAKYLQLLEAPNFSFETLATYGRKLCENFVRLISDLNGIHHENHITLADSIKSVTSLLLGENVPYIVSYLRLLQSCGNVAAHNIESSLSIHDIVAVSIAIIRIYQYLPIVTSTQE